MELLTLIVVLPLLGFLVNGLVGSRLPNSLVSLVACGLPAVSFALTLTQFLALAADPTPVTVTLFTWAATAGLKIDAALYFDQISAVMCLVVTGVGTLIHIYSIGYMAGDKSYSRYFAYLNLFLFFMLMLVLGKNLIMLFIGWEGVGLASYLLIGFWFQDSEKTAAGLKAFIVNRVGDTGFILAAFLIYFHAGTFDFQDINAFFSASQPSALVVNAIGLLLLLGACGKSAQIPLHVWLPDAMAGPTPVSALIHAATMVTAGVYLLARLNGLFLSAADAMTVVAWIGAMTALIGATMGVVEFNLKKVLAYSTISQIGLMVLACGVGAFSAGLFHLYTHAFFKACLFLAAGAVLHALQGEEDMRKMGALAGKMPFTLAVFLLATLALCGVPPFAGFFSKDEILWRAWSSASGSPWLWVVASAASFLTAFYMFRAIFLTFFGAGNVRQELAHGIHALPFSMSIVLGVLALGSIVAGLIGLPEFWRELLGISAPFYDFLAPVLGDPIERQGVDHALEFRLMVIAVVVALLGILSAWLMYIRHRDWAARLKQRVGPAYELVRRGYFFDAAYSGVIVRFMDWLSASLFPRAVESTLTEGTIIKPAWTGHMMSRLFVRLQSGSTQGYVLYALVGLAVLLWWGASPV